MKALKIGGIAFLIVVLAVAGLIFYGVSNLDKLVEMTVERVGSDVTGTKVELANANIQLRDGRGELKGLTIANPEGYTTKNAFSLGTIALDLDPATLMQDVITIEEITIDAAMITAEEKELQQTNLSDIAKHVSSVSGGGGTDTTATKEDSSGAPKLRVERFVFSNAKLDLVSSRFGDRTVAFPTLNASDIGGAAGLPPEALAGALMSIVLDQARAVAQKEMTNAAKERVREELKDQVDEKLSDEDKDKLDKLKSVLGR